MDVSENAHGQLDGSAPEPGAPCESSSRQGRVDGLEGEKKELQNVPPSVPSKAEVCYKTCVKWRLNSHSGASERAGGRRRGRTFLLHV